MSLGDITSTEGLLTALFTEAVMTIIFHGTWVGPWTLQLFGLTDTMHGVHEVAEIAGAVMHP